MSAFRKNLITLVLIFLVYAWFFAFKVVQDPSSVNVLGASSNVSVFIQPDEGQAPIVDVIDKAQTEVLVEVYLLSDKDIIASLENAKQRGVDVKVMLEKHPFGGAGLNDKAKQELEASDISFAWTNPKFSLTHEKAIIVDKKAVFILNQNLTTSAFKSNREYDVFDTNPEDVSQVRAIFVSDWQRQDISVQQSHLVISPNNSRTVIENLIKEAKVSISLEIEVIGDDEVVTLLSEKAKNSTVNILAPPISKLSSNKTALKKLAAAGAHIKTLSSPYPHAKMMIIDGKKAYIGSINFSTQSMDKNRELGIILSESDGLKLLLNTFNKDWDKAKNF